MKAIHFTKEQVERKEHEELNPDVFDFRWNADYTECDAIPLLWRDDASYAAYQAPGQELNRYEDGGPIFTGDM